MSEASRNRTRLAGLCLSAVFVVLAGKAGYLALSGPSGSAGARGQDAAKIVRADIVDRNGELLATSVTSYDLIANPKLVWDAGETAERLVGLFPDLDEADLSERLALQNREFEWIKRGLTPRQRQAVFNLGLEGLFFQESSRRAYPRGTLAGHVLGYTNIDGFGAGGVEYSLNDRLAGGGEPVRLTLDNGVQAAVEAELSSAAARHDVIGGAAVLLDAQSGEVRAMASWPPFDPNRALAVGKEDPSRLNRAAGALFELGSVFKPFTIAAAIEAGAVHPTELFDVRHPMEIHGFTIKDDHPTSGTADAEEIISQSSNIGTVLINKRLGMRRQMDFLDRAGLTDRAPVEIGGSARPILPETQNELSSATMSYGHGIAVTPLAFLSAFASFANGGERMSPTILADREDRPRPVRVMSALTAEIVGVMMRDAVVNGTGKKAEVAGYRVAGKTGTAEKPVAGGYDDTRNVTSFAAIFPYDRPQYALIVTLDEPKRGEEGGATAAFNAAPTAGRIIERVAPLLGLTPRFEDIRPDGISPRSRTAERNSL